MAGAIIRPPLLLASLIRARFICFRLLCDCTRAAASRTFHIAGNTSRTRPVVRTLRQPRTTPVLAVLLVGGAARLGSGDRARAGLGRLGRLDGGLRAGHGRLGAAGRAPDAAADVLFIRLELATAGTGELNGHGRPR